MTYHAKYEKAVHSNSLSRITFVSVLAPPHSWKHLRLPHMPDTICIPFYRRGIPFCASCSVNANDAFAENSIQVSERICAPNCFITTKAAGSMRFRWNEQNANRASYFLSAGLLDRVAPVELIHSRNVIRADSPDDTYNMKCDGIITRSSHIVPVITVADCVPIYLFEPETGVFGVVHSGWKGTGIAVQALKQAAQEFGARPENMLIVLGPHIQSCCYTVDAARAEYFSEQFTPSCISVCARNAGDSCGADIPRRSAAHKRMNPAAMPLENERYPERSAAGFVHVPYLFRLSLAAANIADLTRNGVLPENILCCTDCTCCSSVFGSFRRETADESADKKYGAAEDKNEAASVPRFTPMAAYCRF